MPSEAIAEKNSTARIAPPPSPATPWRVQAVSLLPDYRLAVTFMDGRTGIVDCSAVVSSSNPGIYAPLATREFFAQVTIDMGVLTWPNGADLDPAWLYDSVSDGKPWSVPF